MLVRQSEANISIVSFYTQNILEVQNTRKMLVRQANILIVSFYTNKTQPLALSSVQQQKGIKFTLQSNQNDRSQYKNRSWTPVRRRGGEHFKVTSACPDQQSHNPWSVLAP